jgi:hypothetical protein
VAFRQAFPHLENPTSKKESPMISKVKAAAAAIIFTVLASSALMILLKGVALASNM